MKKFSGVILSLILAVSVGAVNVLAVEDTDDGFLYGESEDFIQEEDPAEQGPENTGTNELNSVAEKSEDNKTNEEALSSENSEGTESEYAEEAEIQYETSDEIQELNDTSETEWTEVSLSLTYDDRYSLEDLPEISGADEEYVIFEISDNSESYQVLDGKETKTKDEVVTLESEDSLDIIATGIGTAKIYLVPASQAEASEVTENAISEEDDASSVNTDSENDGPEAVESGILVTLDVEPAILTLMFLTGQSNMEGFCSTSTGYERDASIACEAGTVYSTYAPTQSDPADQIAGISFNEYCTADNASDFVAKALSGDDSLLSLSGKSLAYPLDSLTTDGSGKTGSDSGLAYEWNRLTGDKVWVINTAWLGSNIENWVPGATYYKRSEAVWDCVNEVYEAEIDAGHYEEGKRLAFWLQGETGDKTKATTDYMSDLSEISDAMNDDLGLDSLGIIMVRASTGSYTNEDEWEMTGPRTAQYIMGNSKDFPNVYVVSNANEQWVSDSGVKSYFQGAYSGDKLSYPMQGSSKTSLPTTVNEVHSDIHYSQIGHNENGITAANGIYQALCGSNSPADVEWQWKDEDGQTVSSSLNIDLIGQTTVLVPVADPVYASKGISCSVSGNAVSYDESTGIVTAVNTGTSVITVSYNGETVSQISVNVLWSPDLRSIVGDKYNGVYYYQGDYWYLENGIIQVDFEGVEKCEDNGIWYYIKNGKADFSYTGFAQNSNGWWYIENGKVTFNTNSVIKDTSGKIDGTESWWYVVDSKVQSNFTGLADYSNENGWWYISNGKVTFDVNTVAQNKNGWFYVEDSQVKFSYTGFAQNSNGWWYIESGKVTFNQNSVIKDTNKKIDGEESWWYVLGSKVQTDFTGLADYSNSNGWWYINNGKVTFNVTTVAKNKNGWWYVEGSQVKFSYNGFAQNSNGWWYIEDGRVTFDTNSVIKDTAKKIDGTDSWWYVVGSQVKTNFTGLADYSNANGWWYINKGKVDFSENTVAKNKNGWWYILNGQVKFGFTGLADYSNANGWWYIKNGKVDFSAKTVAKNKNGWWYVNKGKVDFSFNGISSNANGSWYIQGGQVIFSYSGTYRYNRKTYKIVNGRVQK